MSYSVCIACEEMVSGYQKYCVDCEQRLGVENSKDYWRSHGWPSPEKRKEIITADFKKYSIRDVE